MKNKKGFTLIELLAVVIILSIVLSLAIGAYIIYLNKSRLKTFHIEEQSMVSATREAYADCSSNHPNNEFCKYHQELNTKYTYELIYLKELVDDNYIHSIKNPYDTEKFCDIDKSYVYASSRNNTSQNNNSDIIYKACLICGDHRSKECLDDDLDYSTFDTTCTAYYDEVGGEVYDGAWTDRTIYLSFGASGNYRYGIDEFEYTVGGKNLTSIDANRDTYTATLKIDKNVGNQEYQVQAFDGMNGKGTVASCGANIKIDKSSINSVTLTGKTKSGVTVVSDKWATEEVILTANVNPSTSTSGYLYQWYLNGEKYGEQTTSNTLIAPGRGTYQVEVTNRVEKQRQISNELSIKVDTKAPTCTLAASGTNYNGVYTDNVTISFSSTADLEKEGLEGSGVVSQTIDTPLLTKDGKNTVITGTVTDGVGRKGTCTIAVTKDTKTPTISPKSSNNNITEGTNKSITDFFDISFGASGGSTTCKVGDKVVNNTNDLQFGVNTVTCTATGNNGKTSTTQATFKHQYTATGSCSSGTLVNNNACSFTENASICGTTCHYGCDSVYNPCKTGSPNECVPGYTSNCLNYSCYLYKKCTKCSCTVFTTDTYNCNQESFKRDCETQESSGGIGKASFSTGRFAGCGGSEYVTGSECNNAKSRDCIEYEYSSCATTQNTCQGGYEEKNCSSCKTTTANSCTKTSYLNYSCPRSGKNGNTGATLTPTLGSKVCNDSTCTTIPTCSF